jgi:glutamyl-tRNA synthetase
LQIDEWLDYAPVFSIGSEFENACAYVNDYLLHHTFLVGFNFTIADITIWAALAGT